MAQGVGQYLLNASFTVVEEDANICGNDKNNAEFVIKWHIV